MPVETGHIQITEFSKEVIPQINHMLEDLFCQYGVAMPYFLLDFKFPDYPQRPEWITYSPPEWYLPEWKAYWPTYLNQWPTCLNQWPDWLPTNGFTFGSDWGEWGYLLPSFNELLGLLFDEADLPREMLPDLSPASMVLFNDYITILYESVSVEQELTRVAGLNSKWRVGRGDHAENFIVDELVINEYSQQGYVDKVMTGYLVMRDYGTGLATGSTIVGQTSGATGVVHRLWKQNPWMGHLILEDTYAEARTDYEDAPAWTAGTMSNIYAYFGSRHFDWTERYEIAAYNSYITYDTRESPTISTVKLSFTGVQATLSNTEENPVLYVYKHDYADLENDSTDWTGGTKIAERTFTTADNWTTVEITLTADDITRGDYTKFRFALKRVVEDNYWDQPGEDENISHSLLVISAKLKINC